VPTFQLFVYLFLSLCLLTSCGGGVSIGVSAADAQASTNPASTSTSTNAPTNTATSTTTTTSTSTISSTDTLNFAQFWNENASTAFVSTGQISAYIFKDTSYAKLDSSVLSVNKVLGQSTLKIRQDNHGAGNGDLVTISGLQMPLHGIDTKNLNATHTITLIDINYFAINVLGVASSTALESFNAKLNYKILECVGKQVIEKSAVETTTQFYNAYPLVRTKTVVDTTLSNCSPPTSQFTTYRYYINQYSCRIAGACGNNYELVRQELVGGLYSFPQDPFLNLFPSGTLKSGDKNDVGVLLNYSDAPRTDKQGKTVLSYEVLSDTCCSIVLVINSKTYDPNGTLLVEAKDYYGKSASSIGLPYSLLKTVANYNTPLKNEVSVVYSGLKMAGN
jgi:hypothetical protein